MKSIIQNEEGFSLVELIVAIIVGAIMAAAITPLMRTTILSYQTVTTVTDSYQSSRIAYNRMLAELRMIPDTDNVTAITASSITFTDKNGNSITYSSSGGQLLRNGYTFVDGVSSFSITPKDIDGNTLTSTPQDDSVWTYEITMTVTAEIGNTTNSINFQSEVTPRNFHL